MHNKFGIWYSISDRTHREKIEKFGKIHHYLLTKIKPVCVFIDYKLGITRCKDLFGSSWAQSKWILMHDDGGDCILSTELIHHLYNLIVLIGTLTLFIATAAKSKEEEFEHLKCNSNPSTWHVIAWRIALTCKRYAGEDWRWCILTFCLNLHSKAKARAEN